MVDGDMGEGKDIAYVPKVDKKCAIKGKQRDQDNHASDQQTEHEDGL